MIQRIKNNLTAFIRRFWILWGGLSALAGVWLSFVTWEDMGITGKSNRILILLSVVFLSAIIAVVTVLCSKQKKIFGDVNKGVTLCYDDIIKIGFPQQDGLKKIVVIPVNRCFDLSCENNLISRTSIHGQWIEQYIRSNEDRELINQKIQQFLGDSGVQFDVLTRENKKEGNLNRYKPGTVVELEGQHNVTFYLLALSALNKDLKAYCTEMEFFETLQGLVEYYDAHGQGESLYCPIMGDHIVRPIHETKDILRLMLSVFRFNNRKIHGKLHLIIYDKMKADISILEC